MDHTESLDAISEQMKCLTFRLAGRIKKIERAIIGQGDHR
jgi:hypothetical protein